MIVVLVLSTVSTHTHTRAHRCALGHCTFVMSLQRRWLIEKNDIYEYRV